MINTFHTSLPPPPIPPRQGLQRPAPGRMTPLLWFLSVAMVLQMGVTFGGFVYLFRRSYTLQTEVQNRQYDDLIVLKRLQECDDNPDHDTLLDCAKLLNKYRSIILKVSQTEGKAGLLTGPMPFYGSGAVAHMTVERPSDSSPPKKLKWNRDHSLLMKVEYISSPGALKITIPGDYYVYSQVTFTRVNPKIPLAQTIVRKTVVEQKTRENVLLKAFCNMKEQGQPQTSFQGGVFKLENGDELSLNVTDTSLINFDVTTTAFGLFKL